MKKQFWLLIVSILLTSCARVGSPVGGNKDTLAPQFLGANIDTTRVNVPRDIKELRLNFDEYIKLKDIQKNLIISPPIKKIKKIMPSNLATKFVSIQFEDTLQANTTYQFNFGNSIQDNNESNPLRYFNFAFSTGEKIDDTYISGEVQEAFDIAKNNAPQDNKNVVGLYKHSDSLNFKEKPYYISRVDDDGYFELEYLTPGKYQLIAFSDENENSIYDAGTEKIAFQKEPIVIEKSISGISMHLMPSEKKVKYLETKATDGGILVLFEGNPKNVDIQPIENSLGDFKMIHQKFSDSAMVYINPSEQEEKQSKRIQFSYQTPTKSDTVSTYYQAVKDVELTIKNNNDSKIAPRKEFVFDANLDIEKINQKKWTLKIDSTQAIDFQAEINPKNPHQVIVKANFEEEKNYQLTIPKETIHSYFETLGKSYRFDFEINKAENYGKCVFRLTNKPSSKFWIQLLDGNRNVKFEQYTNASEIKFELLPPGQYYVRILVDENENEFWDAANLEKQVFAEKSIVFYKILNIRPLWQIVEDWDLNSKKKLTSTIKSTIQNNNSSKKEQKPDEIFNNSSFQNKQNLELLK